MKRMSDEQEMAKFVAETPVMSRMIIKRAFDGTASPRQAIKAKCLDCCHWGREEIAECTVILCPLHAYRPFQKGRKGGAARPVEGVGDGSAILDPGISS